MSEKIGIKADYINRLLVIHELIIGDLAGLVAVLGNGFFVVTKETARELTERGVEFAEVEIVKGRPPSSEQMPKEAEGTCNIKEV